MAYAILQCRASVHIAHVFLSMLHPNEAIQTISRDGFIWSELITINYAQPIPSNLRQNILTMNIRIYQRFPPRRSWYDAENLSIWAVEAAVQIRREAVFCGF